MCRSLDADKCHQNGRKPIHAGRSTDCGGGLSLERPPWRSSGCWDAWNAVLHGSLTFAHSLCGVGREFPICRAKWPVTPVHSRGFCRVTLPRITETVSRCAEPRSLHDSRTLCALRPEFLHGRESAWTSTRRERGLVETMGC